MTVIAWVVWLMIPVATGLVKLNAVIALAEELAAPEVFEPPPLHPVARRIAMSSGIKNDIGDFMIYPPCLNSAICFYYENAPFLGASSAREEVELPTIRYKNMRL
jgi:hypothetical protein